MKKQPKYLAFGFLLGFLLFTGAAQARSAPMVLDSVGIERINNKLFVVYRVSAGQTLFSIARRYNSSVDAIKNANPNIIGSVQTNQVIRIPYSGSSIAQPETKTAQAADMKTPQKAEKPESAKTAGIHVVEAGQTLYAVATLHKVLMADIRRWNKLTADQLEPGQRLIVSEKAYKASTTAAAKPLPEAPKPEPVRAEPAPKIEVAKAEPKPEPVKVEPVKTEPTPAEPAHTPAAKTEVDSPATAKVESGTADRMVITPTETSRPAPEVNRPIRPGDSAPLPTTIKSRKRVSEIGLAEIIDEDNSNKYLALHRTAPVGSLVQVRNDVNNQVVWVKVIGKLPDTGVNDRIIIKLSARAFEKLSPHDRRFRAEVNYLAQ